MNGLKKINLYRENYNIMRRFFAKPITLALGVAFALLYLFPLISRIIFGTFFVNPFYYSLNLFMALGFLALYSCSRSKNPNASLNSQITYIKICSIVSIAIDSACILVLIGLIFLSIFEPTFIIAVLIGLICIVPALLSQIGLLMMTVSFKKNLSTIYLYRKGSILTAVSYIILSVISIITIFFYDFILNIEKSVTYKILGSNAAILYSEPSEQALLMSSFESGISFVLNILMIIFALSFYIYIKKISEEINVGTTSRYKNQAVKEQPAQEEFTPTPVFESGEQINIPNMTAPSDFTPQPVFPNQEFEIENQNDNNYCPKCGKINPADMSFCGYCGYKLK